MTRQRLQAEVFSPTQSTSSGQTETSRQPSGSSNNAAVPCYENAHLVAQDLIERIRELLQDQPAPDCDVPIDWGHVGSMAEVTRRLSTA